MMSVVSKEQLIRKFQALPDDPREAYNQLCDILSGIDFSKTAQDFDEFTLRMLMRFAERHDIRLPRPNSEESSHQTVQNILEFSRRERENAALEELLDNYDKRIGHEQFGYAVLTEDEREAILSRIADVRHVITTSSLRESKRIILLKKLSQLEIEVQSDRTPTERFFGFMADLAFVAGEMAHNARPAIQEFKDVLRIVMRSRAKAEGVALPKADQWPQLPGPEEVGES